MENDDDDGGGEVCFWTMYGDIGGWAKKRFASYG